MANDKNLGVFWGNDSFSFVETVGDSPSKIIEAPVHQVEEDPLQSKGLAEDIKYVALIQKVLRENLISIQETHFALPFRDIIIRSFVIPFMKQSEIQNVLEFEVKRYIPFNLNDLAYAYHATTLVENKAKRLRILFVAVRKDTLNKYTSVFNQAGLKVVYTEPAAMSLVRLLILKGHLTLEQRVAIIITDYHESKIIIVDKGIPQFVRDFQIHTPMDDSAAFDENLLKTKLFNEIKISMDFYTRQYSPEKINEVLAMAYNENASLVEALGKELEAKVKFVNMATLIRLTNARGLGLLFAYGSAVKDTKAVPGNFNLSEDPKKKAAAAASDRISVKNLKDLKNLPKDIVSHIMVGGVCLFLVFSVSAFLKFRIAHDKKKVERLTEDLGHFVAMKDPEIDKKIKEAELKLTTLKDIQLKTGVAYLLKEVPAILPRGVWLNNLTVRYVTTSVKKRPKDPPRNITTVNLEMDGYIFTEDPNMQISAINQMVVDLKSHETFKSIFQAVDLMAVETQTFLNKPVKTFRVVCRQ